MTDTSAIAIMFAICANACLVALLALPMLSPELARLTVRRRSADR